MSFWRFMDGAYQPSAALMGVAVAGMHYTGMAASYFFPGQEAGAAGSPMDTSLIVSMTTLITILVLGITIYGVILDSWRRISPTPLDALQEESLRH